VALAHPRAADRDEFLAAVRRSEPLHDPWVHPPATPGEWSAYLRRVRGRERFAYHARRLDDGGLVGVVNVNDVIRGNLQQAFVGYYGFVPYTGQGYMTEVLQLVVRECFATLDLHRVEANIQPDNVPSRALARRCGFSCEGFSPRYLRVGGQWRDHERWAITREAWARLGRSSPPPPGG
jgi:[ribosomal protein S5]-alanine N-acetyltransferase